MISYSQCKHIKVRRIMKMLQESEFQALCEVIICLLSQKFSLRHKRCFLKRKVIKPMALVSHLVRLMCLVAKETLPEPKPGAAFATLSEVYSTV